MAYVTGKSGSFVIHGTKDLDFKVYWTETYQLDTNTSIVTLKPYCIIQQGGGGPRYYLDGTISCNGVQLVAMESTTPTHYFDGSYRVEKQIITNSSKAQLVLTSGAITHNADGTKSVAVSANFYGYTVDGSGINAFQVSGSQTITLTAIPRGATIQTAPNFTDEQNPTITYSNPAGNAVDSLEACISLTGASSDVTYRSISKTGTSYTFELTDAERDVLRAATTTSNTRSVRFYVRTVIAGVSYHSYTTKTLTIVNANPVISPTIVDNNSTTVALTGDSSKLVRYYSNAKITIGVSTQKKASISSKSVTNSGKTLTADGTINSITNGTFNFTAKDSRGNSISKTVTKTTVDYVKLTCSIGNNKPDTDGNLTFKVTGNCFKGSFGAVNNSVTVSYRYKVYGSNTYINDDWEPMSVTVGTNSYTATISVSGLDYQTTYVFEAYAFDKLATVTAEPKNVRATPVFDWGPDDFNINVPLTVGGEIKQQGLSVLTSKTGVIFTGGTAIPENADLNSATYQTLGNYYCKQNVIAATLTNCPTTKAFTMKVFNSTGTGYVAQLIIEYDSGTVYYRHYSSGWKSWTKIAGAASTNADTVDNQHFHWELGNPSAPTFLWGSPGNGHAYVYYPSNISVKYATTAGSAPASNIGFAKLSGITMSNGYGTVSCSGVTTSSVIVGSRVATSGDTSGSYTGVGAVRCDANGTVKIYSTGGNANTWTVCLFWSKQVMKYVYLYR